MSGPAPDTDEARSPIELPELRIARVLARVVYDFPRARSWLLTRHGQRASERLTDIVMANCATYRRRA